jgi:hypothetical protein
MFIYSEATALKQQEWILCLLFGWAMSVAFQLNFVGLMCILFQDWPKFFNKCSAFNTSACWKWLYTCNLFVHCFTCGGGLWQTYFKYLHCCDLVWNAHGHIGRNTSVSLKHTTLCSVLCLIVIRVYFCCAVYWALCSLKL